MIAILIFAIIGIISLTGDIALHNEYEKNYLAKI